MFVGLSNCTKKIKSNTKNFGIPVSKNMIWAESKTFLMGAKPTDQFAMKRENQHKG